MPIVTQIPSFLPINLNEKLLQFWKTTEILQTCCGKASRTTKSEADNKAVFNDITPCKTVHQVNHSSRITIYIHHEKRAGLKSS